MVQAEVWLGDPIELGTYGRIAGCRYIYASKYIVRREKKITKMDQN